MENLVAQGEALVADAPPDGAELESSLATLRGRWRALQEDAHRRKRALFEAVPRWRRYRDEAAAAEAWLAGLAGRIEESRDDQDALEVSFAQDLGRPGCPRGAGHLRSHAPEVLRKHLKTVRRQW